MILIQFLFCVGNYKICPIWGIGNVSPLSGDGKWLEKGMSRNHLSWISRYMFTKAEGKLLCSSNLFVCYQYIYIYTQQVESEMCHYYHLSVWVGVTVINAVKVFMNCFSVVVIILFSASVFLVRCTRGVQDVRGLTMKE